jgi:hypothetical protein
MEGPTALQLATTEELLEQLAARHDVVVFAGLRTSTARTFGAKVESKSIFRYSSGCDYAALGLIDTLRRGLVEHIENGMEEDDDDDE